MTTHDSTSWNVHRDTLRSVAHEVDGIRYVGGRGVQLNGLLDQTYIDEALQLGNDLAECLAALPTPMARHTLDSLKGILGDAAEHRRENPAPTTWIDPTIAEGLGLTVEVEPVTVESPEVDPGLKRARRRREDAAAALDDHRSDGTGEVDAIVATGA